MIIVNEFRVVAEGPIEWRKFCHGLDRKFVVLRSSAAAEHSASVAGLELHARNITSPPRPLALRHGRVQNYMVQ